VQASAHGNGPPCCAERCADGAEAGEMTITKSESSAEIAVKADVLRSSFANGRWRCGPVIEFGTIDPGVVVVGGGR
jgi:hypothetical protein